MKQIVNRKALFNYLVLEKFEAGISLTGNEIKSIRSGKISLSEAHVFIREGEAFLINAHIDLYDKGTGAEDAKRDRKLLLHKSEIDYLIGKMAGANLTAVPLRLYFKRNYAKIELALARGKRKADRREAIKKREAEKDAQKFLRKEKLEYQRKAPKK